MENYKSIEEQLKDMPEAGIIPIKRNKTTPIAIIIIGLIVLILGIIGITHNNTLNTVFDIAGALLLLCGAIVFLRFAKVTYIFQPTREKIEKFELCFNHESIVKMNQFLSDERNNSLKGIAVEDTSNNLLKVMSSEKGTFILAQVWEYIPFSYHPASLVYLLNDDKSKLFFDHFLKK